MAPALTVIVEHIAPDKVTLVLVQGAGGRLIELPRGGMFDVRVLPVDQPAIEVKVRGQD